MTWCKFSVMKSCKFSVMTYCKFYVMTSCKFSVMKRCKFSVMTCCKFLSWYGASSLPWTVANNFTLHVAIVKNDKYFIRKSCNSFIALSWLIKKTLSWNVARFYHGMQHLFSKYFVMACNTYLLMHIALTVLHFVMACVLSCVLSQFIHKKY